MLLSEMASLLEARCIEYQALTSPIEIHIQTDSRLVKPGDIFIAIPGEKLDGFQFIPDAITHGAIGVIAEKTHPHAHSAFELIVSSPTQALLTAARKALGKTSAKQIGITGSAGKTTVKEMLSAVLSAAYPVAKTTGNYNTPIGVPISILAMDPGVDFFVTELSASYPGEIDQNLSYLSLSEAIITSIGASHLEYFHSVENVLTEKMKIRKALSDTGRLLLPGDNPLVHSHPPESPCLFFGLEPANDVQASQIRYETNGIHFDVRMPTETISDLCLMAFGEHMVQNALPIVYLARKYGVSIEAIRKVLAAFTAPVGRGRYIQFQAGFCIIDETYNANPVSFSAALKAFDSTPFRRKILVFSDMLELGERASFLHQALAEQIARVAFHTILYYGDFNSIMEPLLNTSGVHYHYLNSLEETEQRFLQIVQPGDGVLMKASNGKRLSDIIRHLEQTIW